MEPEYRPLLIWHSFSLPFVVVLLLVSSLNVALLWKQMSISWIQGTDDAHNRLPGTFDDATMELKHDRLPVLEEGRTWKGLGHGGFIRQGMEGELSFDVSMYHQLHCLNQIRTSYISKLNSIQHISDPMPSNRSSSAVQSPDQPSPDSRDPVGHANHCFQYIVQAVLCRADSSLIPTPQNRPEGADNHLYRCRDWSSIREVVLKNREKWKGVPYTTE